MDVTQSFQSFITKINNEQLKIGGIVSFNTTDVSDNKCTVNNITIELFDLQYAHINNVKFKNCTFNNVDFWYTQMHSCDFEDCIFYSSEFQDAEFTKCGLYNCRFEKCNLYEAYFLDVIFDNVTFNHCSEIEGICLTSCHIINLNFNDSNIFDSVINLFKATPHKHLFFNRCKVESTHFQDVSLIGTVFVDCLLIFSVFTSCIIKDEAFENNTKVSDEDYNSLDLFSILFSPKLSARTLSLFAIANCDPKEYVEAMVTPIKYQSVFISYSFRDSVFAEFLNSVIRKKGVNTFLWKHDAPGGKRLKTIMKENIRKYDRVLFIASKDSLKSEACHYELAEARDIQNREWKDIYYPIHIDDYLFKVAEEEIPRMHRDKYWTNIQEIREFHSIDFCHFKDNYHNNPAFYEQVEKLVKDLKV